MSARVIEHDPGEHVEGLAQLIPHHSPALDEQFVAWSQGRFVLLGCEACGRLRAPAAPVCPYCGSTEAGWRDAPTTGTVFSWIRYHRGYLPAFAHLMPYAVLCVQLDDGPRVYGRWIGEGDPTTGAAVSAVLERWPTGDAVVSFTGPTTEPTTEPTSTDDKETKR